MSTFAIASIDPAAKLHGAQKSIDYNNPSADQIIRELDKNLKTGIETLLEAAQYEHHDIDVLKHLLSVVQMSRNICVWFFRCPETSAFGCSDVLKHLLSVVQMF